MIRFFHLLLAQLPVSPPPPLQPPPSLLCPLVVLRFDRDLCGREIFGLVWCVRWMEGWGTSGERIGRRRRASMAGTTFGARPAPRTTLWWWFMASSGGCSSLLISGWIVLFCCLFLRLRLWAAVLFGLGVDLIYLRKILISFNLHSFLRVWDAESSSVLLESCWRDSCFDFATLYTKELTTMFIEFCDSLFLCISHTI